MNNQPPQQPQQPPQAPQQQPHAPAGASTAHPRSNYNNNGSNAPNNNRHHYANNNNNNNKPYRKNFNKDGQYQQMPVPYPPYYSPVVYGYPQQQQLQFYYGVPMQSYDQYPTAGYYPPPLNYQPEKQQLHQAKLTDKSGNRIPLSQPGHSRLPSTASPIISLPFIASQTSVDQDFATVPSTPVQATKSLAPEIASATAVSPLKKISDLEKKARNDEFKAKIAARAAALLKLKEEKAKQETSQQVPVVAETPLSKSTNEPETKAVEAKPEPVVVEDPVKKAVVEDVPEKEITVKEESTKEEASQLVPEETKVASPTLPSDEKTDTPVEPTPVVDSAVAEVERTSIEEELKEESKEKLKAESKDEVKEEAEEVKEEATEEIKEEATEEIKEEATEEIKEEATEEDLSSTTTETVPEEKVEPEAPTFTVSNLFNLLRFARPVNPYTYTYPSTVTAPDIKLKGGKKIKYDPRFLIQFQQPLSLPRDEEWDSKYGAKIVITDLRQGNRGIDRSFSRNSSSQFGKGFIGNGPVQMRSQTNLRNNDFNSRSGSRQSSKRKTPKEKSSRNKQGSRRNGLQEDEKPSEPAEPVKPLVKSESRWVPRSRVKALEEVKTAPDGSIILSEEEVNRKVKSLLNKLTLELFDLISGDIINIANQSKWEEDGKTLKTVIELTFAKACDEPHWSSVYAKLCTKMFTDISSEVKDNTVLDSATKQPASGRILVRKYLLTRCQIEYEKGWTDKLPTNEDGSLIEPEMMSDEYYKLAAAKRRGLGLVRFIGELYSLSLLSEKIIVQCISGLVSNIEDPSEDVLENLVQLLNTVGPLIDASRNQALVEFMNSVFDRINKIIETVPMSSRIKFKLMDLIDLRRKKWRGKEADAGPKTMSEIHNEAERKRSEEERASNDRRQNSRRGGDSRSNSSRGGNSNQNLASQWGSSNRVSTNDIKSVGAIRSSDRFGPMNNFKESKSRGGHNDSNSSSFSNSRTPSLSNFKSQQLASPVSQAQSAASSSAPSPSGLAAREGSKRDTSNMFAALEDHDDDNNESPSEDEETSTAPATLESTVEAAEPEVKED